MTPKKDYEDYTRFINDIYVDEKKDLFTKTFSENKSSVFDFKNQVGNMTRVNSTAKNANANTILLEPLTVNLQSSKRNAISGLNTTKRSQSHVKQGRYAGININELDLKPRVLELKAHDNNSFMNISPSFKQVILQQDRKDQRMVIPISGYGGHRRGEKS